MAVELGEQRPGTLFSRFCAWGHGYAPCLFQAVIELVWCMNHWLHAEMWLGPEVASPPSESDRRCFGGGGPGTKHLRLLTGGLSRRGPGLDKLSDVSARLTLSLFSLTGLTEE